MHTKRKLGLSISIWCCQLVDGRKSLDVAWDVENAIEEIVISPYAKPWYAETVKRIVECVAPKLVGEVKSSSMDWPPSSR